MRLDRTLVAILLLSLAGLAVSGYLTWVYTSNTVAMCFGSDGCDAVQHSPYARLLGIPIPTLGAAGYLVLTGLSVAALRLKQRQEMLTLGLFGVALVGVLFSGYLTYLELFVIRAICTWCVVSAVIMLITFLLTVHAYRQTGREVE